MADVQFNNNADVIFYNTGDVIWSKNPPSLSTQAVSDITDNLFEKVA